MRDILQIIFSLLLSQVRAAKRELLPVEGDGSAGGVDGDDGGGLPRVLVLAAVLGLRSRQISVHAGARVDVFKCTAILQSNEQSQKRIVPTVLIRLN